MSATGALVVFLLLWALIGVVAAIVMGRRGHAVYPWTVLGVLLGPLVIPLTVSAVRREQRASKPILHRTDLRSPELAVLVGVDGSEDAMGALVTAIGLFGNRIGRLTIATVLDFALEHTSAGRDEKALAVEMLATHARVGTDLFEREVETTMLFGRPADALVQHALDGKYDLIVVSPRGKGASRVLFGSVASRLARGAGVPVVILPPTKQNMLGTTP
jgi:nucleotide-binding universal stress UspA family protein